MFKKSSLLAVAALACLGGLASCNSTNNEFEQNTEPWNKEDLTLALTGSIDYIEGYTAWSPAFSQQTAALKFTKADNGVYTLDFDFKANQEYKVVSGSTWDQPNYDITNVDLTKSTTSITGAGSDGASGNIKCTADVSVTITFYEYPFNNADKIDTSKKMIISERTAA